MRDKLYWLSCVVVSVTRVALECWPVRLYLTSLHPKTLPHVPFLWYHSLWYQYINDVILLLVLICWSVLLLRVKKVPVSWYVGAVCVALSSAAGMAVRRGHFAFEAGFIALLLLFVATCGPLMQRAMIEDALSGSVKWAPRIYRDVNKPPRLPRF